jgi:hypothetical protein
LEREGDGIQRAEERGFAREAADSPQRYSFSCGNFSSSVVFNLLVKINYSGSLAYVLLVFLDEYPSFSYYVLIYMCVRIRLAFL